MSITLTGSFFEPTGVGPVAQQFQPILPPAPLAPAAVWSELYESNGFRTITAAVELTQSGMLTVQRFVDLKGIIPQGAAAQAPLAAGHVAVLNVVDDLPFASFAVSVSNTSTAAAALSSLTVYQEAR